MNIDAYLKRINYQGARTPSVETLRRLHVAHLMAVPFENLSIHVQEPIILDDQALFEKIVVRRRGGFCYELNGLFSALLRALGFEVHRLSAAVMNDEGQFGPEFDHMTLMVTLEQRWLADVGFGDSFLEPLVLDSREVQAQGLRSYRIDAEDGRYILWQRDGAGAWNAQYRFDLTPRTYDDYAAMCRYHQTSPQSTFTQRRVCSCATPDGRITLRDGRLIRTRDGVRQTQELADEAAFAEALRVHFGMHVNHSSTGSGTPFNTMRT